MSEQNDTNTMSKRQASNNITIIRSRHDTEERYFVMRRATAQDARLSFQARGMLIYLLSKPDDWKVKEGDLMREGECGRDRIRKIIEELIEYGYLKREQSRTTDDSGKTFYGEMIYTIFENPFQSPENQFTESQPTENPTHTNNRKEQTTEENRLAQETAPVSPPEKPKRQRSAGQQRLDAMVDAMVLAFGLVRETVTKKKWAEFRGASSELLEAHATPEDIPGIYAECVKRGWQNFSAYGLSKAWPDYCRDRQRAQARDLHISGPSAATRAESILNGTQEDES